MFGRPKKERFNLQEHNETIFLDVVKNLRMVFDPEIPVNIYDLGLIYNLDIDEDHTVYVRMTLTAPNCPEAETIPGRIQQAVQDAEGVEDVDIELVFDPPWTRERMSTAALLALGLI
ncbi:MAG: iron-sulfur cluster assembly protein [Pontiellaceae bacterium]